MTPDFEKQLYELGPILYQEKDLPMKVTCMCWGFECSDAWFELLKKGTIEIEALNNEFKGLAQVIAQQVKSKFGDLRFYYSIKTLKDDLNKSETEALSALEKKVEDIVSEMETASWDTCYECGKPATKTTSGWITRLCDECFDKDEKAKKERLNALSSD